jgi:hypothetical protein
MLPPKDEHRNIINEKLNKEFSLSLFPPVLYLLLSPLYSAYIVSPNYFTLQGKAFLNTRDYAS